MNRLDSTFDYTGRSNDYLKSIVSLPPQSLCDESCSYVIYVMRPKLHIKKQAAAHIGSLFRENSACTCTYIVNL